MSEYDSGAGLNLWVSDMPDIDIDSLPEEAWRDEEQQS